MIKLNKQGSRWWPYEISSAFFNEHKTQSLPHLHIPATTSMSCLHTSSCLNRKKCCLITGPDPQLTKIGLAPFISAEKENLYRLNIGFMTSGEGLHSSTPADSGHQQQDEEQTPKISISLWFLWHIRDIHSIVSLPHLKYLAPEKPSNRYAS